ncbi:hypothetical protein [Streptomyces cellulosae]|uniref:hypothetical protein n=1 Tax=Streptomyces cellulosae TaxID=1968 RepID=UPI0004CAEC2E|nr:hypothetical protein [Streptomyces cellulosae]
MSTTTRKARGPAPLAVRTQRRLLPRWLLAAVAVALVALITAVSFLARGSAPRQTAAPSPTTTIVTVDGQAVPAREFSLFLAQERAATFAHFQQKFGAADGPHFWTTSHSGQTPADYIKKRALADVTRATVQRGLAHGHGLLGDPSYAAFLRNWAAENTRRQKAVAAHQVIYGPVQYTEANYFTYVLNDLDFELAKKLSDTNVIKTPETALRAYYQAHKSDLRQGGHSSTSSLTEQQGRTAAATTLTYAQARVQVRLAYVADRYQAMLNQLVRSARIRVVASVLDAVPVE